MFGSRASFGSFASAEPETPYFRPWPSHGSTADFSLGGAPPSARSRSQADAFEAGLADELSRRLAQARGPPPEKQP